MTGRRLPLTDGKLTMPTEPGNYCGPVGGYSGDKPAVFFLLPIARDEGVDVCARSVHHCESPPHTFTEEADGTLTIAASILSYNSDGKPGWHGFLEHGIWRTA